MDDNNQAVPATAPVEPAAEPTDMPVEAPAMDAPAEEAAA